MTHTFDAGTGALGIQTSAGDTVAVDCAAPDTTVNGVALAAPNVPCADVQSLTVTGDAAVNSIDISGVTAAKFTGLTSRLVNGGNEPTGPGDTITGSPLADTINGGAGDETINAGDGADTVAGDNGNDSITGGPGNDPDLRGGNANDTMIWNPGDGSDTLNGQGGDDQIRVNGDGSDDQITLAGDADGYDVDMVSPVAAHLEVGASGATDTIVIDAAAGTNSITGSGGLEAAAAMASGTIRTDLRGGAGVDTIIGTDARDAIDGGGDDDDLAGSGGDDSATWDAGDGDDSFDGGTGTDTIQVNGDSSAETFNFGLDSGGDVDINRTFPSSAHIDADETERVGISGGGDADVVTGGSGFAAGGISATLAGGTGTDYLEGTDGDDVLSGNADDDTVIGGEGADQLNWSAGDGTDSFQGGGGIDSASISGDLDPETYTVGPDGPDIDVDRSAPSPGHVDAASIEHLTLNGNAGADTIGAAAGFNPTGTDLTFNGGADADTLTGSDAADTLNGNASSDQVNGAGGDDQLRFDPLATATDEYSGGGGTDTLVSPATSGNDVWTLQPDPGDAAKIRLAKTGVTMRMLAIEHLSMNLGSGSDSVTASGSLGPLGLLSTEILGDSGNDTLTGTDVPDTLDGGTNNDTEHGNGGSDTLVVNGASGTTTDTVTGGADDDTLEFNGDASDEAITVAPDGADTDVDRTSASPAANNHIDVATVEQLEVSGAAGNDDLQFNGDAADDTIAMTRGSGTIVELVRTASPGLSTSVDADAIEAYGVDGAGGADTITGGTGFASLGLGTTLAGGAENDAVTGTDAEDELRGDAGDDSIQSRDGEVDQVDCGADTDTATADAVDVTTACETVLLPVMDPPTTTTPQVTPPAIVTPPDTSACDALRKKLNKAKSKKQRSKIRKQIKKKGC